MISKSGGSPPAEAPIPMSKFGYRVLMGRKLWAKFAGDGRFVMCAQY
jgi:hypothetical protein